MPGMWSYFWDTKEPYPCCFWLLSAHCGFCRRTSVQPGFGVSHCGVLPCSRDHRNACSRNTSPDTTVDSIEVYAFGCELDADGFTAYVGDKPFTLSAYPQPEISHPQISWSIGDSVELSVSSDTLTCEFTALKPTGKNELIVQCYGAKITIPVYLWER